MNYKLFITSLLALTLSGCAWLAPKYQRAALELPEKTPATEQNAKRTHDRLSDWWKEYQDPVLQELIDRALAQNGDLALAAARLQQARAQYDYAFSNQFPLLSVAGFSSRSKLDFKNGDLKAGKSLPPGLLKAGDLLPDRPSNLAFFGGMLSYEFDLWGKLASANQAAKAAYLAASHGRDAVRLSVATAAAQLYFNILALGADIKITSNTIVSRAKSYRLYKSQY